MSVYSGDHFQVVKLKKSFILSCDTGNLFTDVPLLETTDLAMKSIFENDVDTRNSKADPKQRFMFGLKGFLQGFILPHYLQFIRGPPQRRFAETIS